MKKTEKQKLGFSLAEALISLLVVCLITIASIPIITKKHRKINNVKHGYFACYWNAENKLVSKYVIDGEESNGTTLFDEKENREGCVFNPPTGTKNFVATIIGGGGGGSGSGKTVLNGYSSYTEPGTYSYAAEEPGIYQILAIGGGGGGGETYGCSSGCERACFGTSGASVYVQNIILGKNSALSVTVGSGGSASEDKNNRGEYGGSSIVKNQFDGTNYATAGGGGGGCSSNISPFSMGPFGGGDKMGYISGYNLSGGDFIYSAQGQSNLTPMRRMLATLYSGKSSASSSDLSSAEKKDGRRLGPASSSENRNTADYYNLNTNLNSYNSIFGFDFNVVERKNISSLICGSSWESRMSCKEYSNHYGAGGGGGIHNSDDGYNAGARNGIQGAVFIKRRPIYAGLGGGAGKVVQIPYAEMPQKTLAFPGKGGAGGEYASSIRRVTLGTQYTGNAETTGFSGESSFIKNGAIIGGGLGAEKIIPRIEETYSQEINSRSMPIGGNGKLADILTAKKIGTGGLGGYADGNNNLYGLTQSVFKNNATISSFNNIYGAGSGGGGGGITIDSSNNVLGGNGGNGSSGLVFIQW